MSRFGLMVKRWMDPDKVPVLVDLGSVDDKAARACADRLMACGLSRRNFSIEGNARLLVKLPKGKAVDLIKRFRFQTGESYWMCTHQRVGVGVLDKTDARA